MSDEHQTKEEALSLKGADGGERSEAPGSAADTDREARKREAAEARAARVAAAKPGSEAGASSRTEPEEPRKPSPKQPQLDEAAALIRALVAPDAVEEAYLNELNGDMPTLVVKAEHWRQTAELVKHHPSLRCDYLRNVSGVDYETHMEVVYHLVSLDSRKELAFKVRTDREAPSVPSVTPVWQTANWNEREIYDLLGIDFPGHPNLVRIMMPDDWVGHPLRKDYEPFDPEV